MNSTIYLSCQIVVVLIVSGLLSATFKALQFAFKKIRIKKVKRQQLLLFIGGGFGFWLAILVILSFIGFFKDFTTLPPKIIVAILPPVILTVYLLSFSRLFSIILKAIPKSWLIYIQSFRIIMELMLWLGFLGGFVPLQMTFHWLNQDIIVGVTALMGGYFFFWRGRYRRLEAILWNVFGVLLLANIVTIAILSTPSPVRVFTNDPANTFVADIPFIWIPGFIVPFALAVHLFSLKQLIRDKQ